MCTRNPESLFSDALGVLGLDKVKLGILCVGAFCSIGLAESACAASKQIELEPVTPWHVDWAENTCILRRAFGSKEDPVTLQIEQFGPEDGFTLLFAGKVFRPIRLNSRYTVDYGISGFKHKIDRALVGDMKDGSRMVFVGKSGFSREPHKPEDGHNTQFTPEIEKAIKKITISIPAGKEIVLKTGALDRPFAEMRKCTNQLIEEWGLDPEQQKKLLRKPQPTRSPGTWLTSGDYPNVALSQGAQAIISFLLLVDEQGMPAKCEIQRSIVAKGFKDPTCDLLRKRARFDPALDASGKPVPSFYLNMVRWILP